MEKETYFDPQFFGTETWWKNPYGFLYTDSIKDFCEKHKAYWILDVVGSYMSRFKDFNFLVICFDVQDSQCTFYAKEDSGLPNIVEQFIEYTGLIKSIKLYLEEGVLMFPSDH
jgi:hypothetical protein